MAHHPHPRPIQRLAAKVLTEGKNALLCSATASGKTEAYAAPLCERYLEVMKAGQLPVVVVSPTRALVNDLARRLAGPVKRLKIELVRRTGDHPESLEDTRSGLLITTPESLDSLLSRHPKWLGRTRALVLDELHVVHGSPRGEQLRYLVTRLEKVVAALKGPVLQRVGASATVARPEEVARLYLGEAQVLGDSSHREFELDYLEGEAPEFLGPFLDHCLQTRARKVIVFTPSRADAETLAVEARGRAPFQNSVAVHHGSLSRVERERVEAMLLRSPSALCFATNTLELGIDIGDAELVGMLGPPPSLSAFLQRLGRGGRRTGRARGLAICRDGSDRVRFEYLEDRARGSALVGEPYRPTYSVLVQQAFSLTFQNPSRFVSAGALKGRSPIDLGLTESQLEELLEHLVEREWFSQNGTRFVPTEKLHELYRKAKMHHNISADVGGRRVKVVDQSGRALGEVAYDPSKGVPESAILAGQSRSLREVRGGEVRASQGSAASGKARFASSGGPITTTSEARDLAEFLGVEPGQIPMVELESGVCFGHFLGTAWSTLVAPLWRARNKKAKLSLGPLVGWAQTTPDLSVSHSELEARTDRKGSQLASKLRLGPWWSELPDPWKV